MYVFYQCFFWDVPLFLFVFGWCWEHGKHGAWSRRRGGHRKAGQVQGKCVCVCVQVRSAQGVCKLVCFEFALVAGGAAFPSSSFGVVLLSPPSCRWWCRFPTLLLKCPLLGCWPPPSLGGAVSLLAL